MASGLRKPSARRIAVDDQGIWIQYSSDDALGRIGPDGLMFATYSRGADLLCAGVDGAWLRPEEPNRRDISTTPDRPPRREPRSSLLHVDLTGVVSTIPVDGIIWNTQTEEGTLYVSVHHEPWTRVRVDYADSPPSPGGDRYRVVWANSGLSLSLGAPRPDALRRPENIATSWAKDTSYSQDYADETYNEAHLRKRAVGHGVRWHWGHKAHGNKTTLVRAFTDNPTDAELLWANEIDDRRVVRGVAEQHRAWLLTRGSTRSGGRTQLEVWGADTCTVSTLPTFDGLDISAHRWPPGPRPADHHSYAQWCADYFDGMKFTDKVSEVRARFVGDWPDGAIELTYRHHAYPGLRICSRIGIYDALGRKREDPFGWDAALLIEQADTHDYPAASLAVNGVLYV
ncbi:hypothetical protein JTZ10_15150 [Gordonia rubripertincta]|uniref:Uncharacterized protein n=1 Tax=Gordonia rubripertincta TaxID=36822 RepID=A0AAW4G7I8_GORRU|nr:hypothetical protein [Gordonia rubripertincta]MBM7279089.1 hypothetical protein [Gordonia rubripertincta]QMU19891.1 hypothetical protein H3V45_17800 [Gordonia rubripertincta]